MSDFFGEPISVYTSEQATEDGFLLELKMVHEGWKDKPFSHVTMNLLRKGYLNEDGSVNVPNLLDLLNQALAICRRGKREDWFYSGCIELPSGFKQEIFICLNETGKFTVMLPEDF